MIQKIKIESVKNLKSVENCNYKPVGAAVKIIYELSQGKLNNLSVKSQPSDKKVCLVLEGADELVDDVLKRFAAIAGKYYVWKRCLF